MIEGFRAAVDCPEPRCAVQGKDGLLRRSKMYLSTEDRRGKFVEPRYMCERGPEYYTVIVQGEAVGIYGEPCKHHTEPMPAHKVPWGWVQRHSHDSPGQGILPEHESSREVKK